MARKKTKKKQEKRKYPHFEDCQCGDGGTVLSPDHDWWVNSSSHDNCFWTYMRHNARPHTLKEIADLNNKSITSIIVIESKAKERLAKKMKELGITDLVLKA